MLQTLLLKYVCYCKSIDGTWQPDHIHEFLHNEQSDQFLYGIDQLSQRQLSLVSLATYTNSEATTCRSEVAIVGIAFFEGHHFHVVTDYKP